MATFKVTDTRKHTTMTPTGGQRVVYEVWIETDKGVQGSVRIDQEDWQEAKVQEILEAEAEDLNLAFNVSG